MKRYILILFMLSAVLCSWAALPKALYIKKGDNYVKYNFGVAENLNFLDGGSRLAVTGYDEVVDLNKIDFISFSPIADNMSLTPDAQKQRLVEIGDKFNNKVSIHDDEELVKVIDHFIKYYSEYEFNDEYFNLHYTPALKKFMKSIGEIAHGSVSGIRRGRNSVPDLWQASDFYGVFAASSRYEEWIKVQDADYLEFRFSTYDGQTCKAVLKTSDDYTDWTEVDFIGRVPHTITATLTKGSKTMCTVTLKNEIDNDAKACRMDVTVEAGLYTVKNPLTITNSAIYDNVTVSRNGEQLVKADAKVYGHDLTNYDSWKDAIENSTVDDEYYDPYYGEWIYLENTRNDSIVSRFYAATATVDLMGDLQVKSRVSSVKKIFDELKQDPWYDYDNPYDMGVWDYNKNTFTLEVSDKNIVDRQVMYLNNYCDAAFYYDGKPQPQGFIGFVTDEDIYDWYSSGYWNGDRWVDYDFLYIEKDYIPMPYLYFPDGTSFAIEDFFNEDDFRLLIYDYDEIIASYDRLTGSNY